MDGNTPKPAFAKELMDGPPVSGGESARASWGGAQDMNYANLGVCHTGARALVAEQMTWVAVPVALNPDVQVYTSRVLTSGCDPQG